MKRSVLFICTENSARSQMAEALLRNISNDTFEVASAGTSPEEIDPRTLEALERFGVDVTGLHTKHIDELKGRQFDYVISLCDKALKECRQFPNAREHIAWDFEDPKSRPGAKPFDTTLKELNERIKMFLLVQSKKQE